MFWTQSLFLGNSLSGPPKTRVQCHTRPPNFLLPFPSRGRLRAPSLFGTLGGGSVMVGRLVGCAFVCFVFETITSHKHFSWLEWVFQVKFANLHNHFRMAQQLADKKQNEIAKFDALLNQFIARRPNLTIKDVLVVLDALTNKCKRTIDNIAVLEAKQHQYVYRIHARPSDRYHVKHVHCIVSSSDEATQWATKTYQDNDDHVSWSFYPEKVDTSTLTLKELASVDVITPFGQH